MLSRKRDACLSLAVSAMFTSGLLSTAPRGVLAASAGPQPAAVAEALSGLRADGWYAVELVSVQAPAVVPASFPAPAGGSLSETQLQTLVRLANTKGERTKLSQLVTAALGLTTGTDTISPQQYTMHDAQGFGHAFCVLDGASATSSASSTPTTPRSTTWARTSRSRAH